MLELALRKSLDLGHNYIGTEALRTLGVNLEGPAGKIEQVRARALSAERELTQRLEEMTRAMDAR